ncbi:C-type mannose receptor 2-like [Fundulus heteroclitus]|uniref:C-type mannose receptor 2-like n=1 Tax=Fundulus heteroclitus TaxID=8078 RepID=UPI00165AC9B6|nr:C-type mannose receptor 2-like [Fundulus heteroclitus]
MERVLLLCICAASVLRAVCPLLANKYRFVNEMKTWTEAQSFCREKYSDLAAIQGMDDVTMLNEQVDQSKMGDNHVAWIGLYDDMNSWMWSMSDSDFYQHDENFTNWKTEEPNNYAGIESCVEMYDNGRWNDKPCAEQKNSICFDVTGTNVTFVHISIKMNWTDSQRYCREVHTDLASVRNIAENQKVNELMSPGEKVWIGLFRNTWTWSDGTSSAFRYWSSGEPNGNSDNCAAADMKNHGKWEDWNCEVKTTFICSADPVHTKQVKLKVVGSSSVDLNNPDVLEDLLKEMKQKLKDQGVDEDIRLSWKKQEDGKIFHKDEEKSRNNNNNEL